MSSQPLCLSLSALAPKAPRLSWILALVLITLCSTGALSTSAATIDDFSQPNLGTYFMITTDPGPFPATTMGPNAYPFVASNTPSVSLDQTGLGSNTIGGERKTDISVSGVLTADTISGIVGYDADHGLDAMQISTNGVSSITPTVTLTYLPPGVTPDLTNGGLDTYIALTVLSTDETLSITAGLSNGAQQWTYKTTAPSLYDAVHNVYLSQTVLIPFSSFTTMDPTSPAAGTDVNQLTFTFTGDANIDFSIGGISTTNVPEPASAALLALGCVAIGAMVRGKARRRSLSARADVRMH